MSRTTPPSCDQTAASEVRARRHSGAARLPLAVNAPHRPQRERSLPRIALVVPGLAEGGGVPSVALFLYRVLVRTGRYEPVLISVATSRRDASSRRLVQPSSWWSAPRVETGLHAAVPYVHVGCSLTELEFQRYRPRSVLTELLDGCDIVQVVAGTPAWANVARDTRSPVLLQVASLVMVERRAWLARLPIAKRLVRGFLTRITAACDDAGVRHCRMVFVENSWMQAEMLRRLGPERVRFAPPGIDVEHFRPAARDTTDQARGDTAQHGGYLLSVGRFGEPRKNVRVLLEAYRRVRDRLPDAPRLVLAGQQGPTEADLAHAARLGIASYVDVRTALDAQTLARTYREAAVFALSSDEEGLGLVLLEAMASGLPVVSTRCGGPELAVAEGLTGFLVPTADPEAMAERLIQLLGDAELRARMGAAGRRRAVESFSHEATAQRFIAEYDAILGQTADSLGNIPS